MIFHSTVIFVADIERAKTFYTSLLNFTIESDFGSNIILSNGLSLWKISADHIISKHLDTHSKSNRFELYFESEIIEDMYSQLISSGIHFLHPIEEEPWGQRTIRFFDPDNHLIEIGEPLPVFVNNMHKKGMTPSRISEKTGIPIEKVIGLIWK